MEFVENQKGGQLLVYEGFTYRRRRQRGSKVYWSCSKSNTEHCRGACRTENGIVEVTNPVHNHTANPAEVEVRRRLGAMKRQALNSQDSPCQIIASTMSNASLHVASNLPSDALMARTINRARKIKSYAPVNPTSRADLQIPNEYKFTASNEPFLLGDLGTEDRILIYTTITNIRQLADSTVWHSDGTFKCAPAIFHQLYTLHTVINNSTYPCVYALLPDKSEATYTRMLDHLKQLALTNNFVLEPKIIVSDFEAAFVNASSKCFPNVQVQGCYFHFSQCIWRKIQEESEILERYNDVNFALHLRLLPALAFVPAKDVVGSFEVLQDTDFFCENRMLLLPLMIYFEDTWIGRPEREKRRQPVFAHETWSTFIATTEGHARTNNNIEEWHRRFSSLLRTDNPSLWKFIDVLKQEQSHTECRLNQLRIGAPVPAKYKHKALEKRLMSAVEKYSTLPLTDYLTEIACNITFYV